MRNIAKGEFSAFAIIVIVSAHCGLLCSIALHIGHVRSLIVAITAFITATTLYVLSSRYLTPRASMLSRTEAHPLLGELNVTEDGWRTKAAIVLGNTSVIIEGPGTNTGPTKVQEHTLHFIQENYKEIESVASKSVRVLLDESGLAMTDNGHLFSVLVDDNSSVSYTLYFQSTSWSEDARMGLYVDLQQVSAVDAGWLH